MTNRQCQMCGQASDGNIFCSLDCNCYWHYIEKGKSGKSFTNLINVLVERGDEGIFLTSCKMEMLYRFNWLVRIAPATYRLSTQGYRAIELMEAS